MLVSDGRLLYVGSIDHRVGEVARLFGFDTWLVVGDVR